MNGMKKLMLAAAMALAFSAAIAAQAGQKTVTPVGSGTGNGKGQGDIHGVAHRVEALEHAVAVLQAKFSNLSSLVSTIAANPALQLGPFVSVTGEDKDLAGPNIFFSGANVHIVSGSKETDDFGNLRGLGNLIIGYDEEPAVLNPGDRGGSHNLVIGPQHKFSSFGGFVAGATNTVSGADASVSGGQHNVASGSGSVVSGGKFINATGIDQWAHP